MRLLRKSKWFCMGVFLALSFIPAMGLLAQAEKKPIRLRIRIINGTTNQRTGLASLEVLAPAQGMKPIWGIKNTTSEITAVLKTAVRGPLLLRAIYRGEKNTLFLPPNRYQRGNKIVFRVYEPRPMPETMLIGPMTRLLRAKSGLRVVKFFVFDNNAKPPVIFRANQLRFFIPETAENVSMTMEHEKTRMPIPLSPIKDSDGYSIKRGFRPGKSIIAITFRVKNYAFKDRPSLLLKSNGENLPIAAGSVMIVWRPNDARPDISGAELEEITIPQGGKALRARYKKNQAMSIRMKRGGFAIVRSSGPLKASNPIFDTTWKTLWSLTGFTLVFFIIVSLISTSGFRLVRKNRKVVGR